MKEEHRISKVLFFFVVAVVFLEGLLFDCLRAAERVGSCGIAYRACEVDMAEARSIRGMFWLKKALGLVAPMREASRSAHCSRKFEAIRSSASM